MRLSNVQRSLLALVAALCTMPALASAAGYDTPMLYTARHMGMGGTAIGYVSGEPHIARFGLGERLTSR